MALCAQEFVDRLWSLTVQEINRVYCLISPCWIRTLIACEMNLLSLFLLSSKQHFSGLDDQIITLNELTWQLLPSLFLDFWNLG